MRVKTSGIACIASVSVRFRSKERGTRVKHHTKNSASNLNHPLLPQFHFLALVPFLARLKPKIPFLGLSLLQHQTETLATQATSGSSETVTGDRGKNGQNGRRDVTSKLVVVKTSGNVIGFALVSYWPFLPLSPSISPR